MLDRCHATWEPGCDAWGAPYELHGCTRSSGHPGECICLCGVAALINRSRTPKKRIHHGPPT